MRCIALTEALEKELGKNTRLSGKTKSSNNENPK
jgi:hypothetical protein